MQPQILPVDLTSLQSNPVFYAAKAVIATLQQAHFQAYIVGGSPRDILLGRPFFDIDVTTDATPEQVEDLFPNTHRIGISFGVILVVQDDVPIEVASFRTEGEYVDGRHPSQLNYTSDAWRDSARRDFTINAFYLDPVNAQILDFHDGLKDLNRGILRTVGNPLDRFNEDVLRILRAVRFAARYQFQLDTDLRSAIISVAPRIPSLSVERIREELNGMLLSRHPAQAIRMLDELNLLPYVLPELLPLKTCPQSPKFHPEGDVFIHTLLALDVLVAPDLITLWATLLHDIGKPRTLSFGDDGVPHAYGHEAVGAGMAEIIMRRLKFDLKTIEGVVESIRNHMRYVHISQMGYPKVRRLLASPYFYAQFQLLLADIMGSHKDLTPWIQTIDQFARVMNAPALPAPVIKGRHLVEMGITPCADFKQILDTMMEYQLDSKFKTEAEAIPFLKRLIYRKYKYLLP